MTGNSNVAFSSNESLTSYVKRYEPTIDVSTFPLTLISVNSPSSSSFATTNDFFCSSVKESPSVKISFPSTNWEDWARLKVGAVL